MKNSGSDAAEHSFFSGIIHKMKSCCWSILKWRAEKKRRKLIEQLEGIVD